MRPKTLVLLTQLLLATPAALAQSSSDTLQVLEAPTSPQLCTAVRSSSTVAVDRLNSIASDVSVKSKTTLDAAKTANLLRQCVSAVQSALSSLNLIAGLGMRYPDLSGVLSRVADASCQLTNQEINNEVQGLRSSLGSQGGYFGVQSTVTRGIGAVSVNTHDSATYAANCVWDWLNGRVTSCH